jgi:hypothetical protein
MNYQKIYNRLVEYRKQYPATGYVERHHIVPRSMGGSDEAANLVVLTGREHWVAHLLLWKIHKNPQMVYACRMMSMRCQERDIPQVHNSRMYETLRIAHSKLVSSQNKMRSIGVESKSHKLWEQFKNGDYASLRDFSRCIGINVMSLQKWFKKYIDSDEYSSLINRNHSNKTKQRISNSRKIKIVKRSSKANIFCEHF